MGNRLANMVKTCYNSSRAPKRHTSRKNQPYTQQNHTTIHETMPTGQNPLMCSPLGKGLWSLRPRGVCTSSLRHFPPSGPPRQRREQARARDLQGAERLGPSLGTELMATSRTQTQHSTTSQLIPNPNEPCQKPLS